ncbi:helix-turn-helix transcriptional regulator [Gemmatimonadota bacterium]
MNDITIPDEPTCWRLLSPRTVKRLLRQRGITQRHIAASLGVHFSTVCYWLSGDKRMTREAAEYVSGLLGYPVEEIAVEEVRRPSLRLAQSRRGGVENA